MRCFLRPLTLLGAAGLLAACGDDGAGGDEPGPQCWELGPALPSESPAPTPRGDHTAAYDPVCERLFVLTGNVIDPPCPLPLPIPEEPVADAYVFDLPTQTWHQLRVEADSPRPAARTRADAAWDPIAGRLLLFGGRKAPDAPGTREFNDLWAYAPADGRWELLSAQNDDPRNEPIPFPRHSAAVAVAPDADGEGARFIVHAGQFATVQFHDTWAFDLVDGGWTEIATEGDQPPNRISGASVFEPQRREMLVVGGGSAFGMWDPWVLDVDAGLWTSVQGAEDEAVLGRFKPGLALDETTPGRAVLFGGHDNTNRGNSNDLWAFDFTSGVWSLERAGDVLDNPSRGQCDFPGDFVTTDLGSPERRAGHVLVSAGEHGVLLFGGTTDCDRAADTWLLAPDDAGDLVWEELIPSPFGAGLSCRRKGNSAEFCSRDVSSLCEG